MATSNQSSVKGSPDLSITTSKSTIESKSTNTSKSSNKSKSTIISKSIKDQKLSIKSTSKHSSDDLQSCSPEDEDSKSTSSSSESFKDAPETELPSKLHSQPRVRRTSSFKSIASSGKSDNVKKKGSRFSFSATVVNFLKEVVPKTLIKKRRSHILKEKYIEGIPKVQHNDEHPPKLYLGVGVVCVNVVLGGYLSLIMVGDPDDVDGLVEKDFKTSKQSTIAIIFPCALLSCLIAPWINDFIGRKFTTILFSVITMIGGFVSMMSFHLRHVYIGIVFVALAPFTINTAALAYIVECSSAENRGSMVSVYMVSISIGVVFADAVPLLFEEYQANIKWRLFLGCCGFFGIVVIFFHRMFTESPWFFVMRGDIQSAKKILNGLRRNSDLAHREITRITYAYAVTHNIVRAQFKGDLFVMKGIMQTPHVRKAFLLSIGLLVILAFCGVSRVILQKYVLVFYNPHDVRLIEIMYHLVNVSAMAIIFSFLDVYGRRFTLMLGFAGMSFSLVLLSLSTYEQQVYSFIAFPEHAAYYDECNVHTNCWECIAVNSSHCGFCYRVVDSVPVSGSCVKNTPVSQYEGTQCSLKENDPDFIFTTDHCPTRQKIVSIISLSMFHVFYWCFCAHGVYTFVVESAPQWARTRFCTTISITNLIVYGVTKTIVISLFGDVFYLTLPTLFATFSFASAFGVIFVYLFVPETAGRPLEYTELLFMNKPLRQKTAKQINDQFRANW